MPEAVTHILVPLIIMSLIRDYVLSKNAKAHFPLHYVFIAGLAGALPDIDIGLSVILKLFGITNWWIHKTFTHSLFFSLIFFTGFLIFNSARKPIHLCTIRKHSLRISTICLMISFGTLTHILLDSLAGEMAYFFYPFSMHDYGLNLFALTGLPWATTAALLDGILLILWLAYLEFKHKISDFI